MHETARRPVGLSRLFLFVLFAAAVGFAAASMPLQKIANQSHANTKHAKAPAIRRAHRNGLCREVEAYVSPGRGTLLVLCKPDEGPDEGAPWGGLIWRVLEERAGAMTLLDPGDLYECTVFAADRSYWNRVVVRDGYVKAADTRWYGALRWLIFP